MRLITTAFFVLLTHIPSLSSAEVYDAETRFQWLEASLTGMRYATDASRLEDRSTYGLDLGFAYSDKWLLTGGFATDNDSEYSYLHVDIHRYFFPEQRIKPFATAGLGTVGGETIDTASFFSYGAGLRIPVSKHLALEPYMRWHQEITSKASDAGAGLRLTVKLTHRRYIGDGFDSDGDGVPDNKDKCPATPVGVEVDRDGCPLEAQIAQVDGDDDLDGVLNSQDRCPNTPAGATVDEFGCTVIEEPTILPSAEVEKRLASLVTEDTVNFELESSRITANAGYLLEDYILRVEGKPLEVLVAGHTDTTGSLEYNQALSQRRAQAVANYLSGRGIQTEIITEQAYGELKPEFDNAKRANRMRNRRVDMTIRSLAEQSDEQVNAAETKRYASAYSLDRIHFELETAYIEPNAERMLNRLAAYLLENQGIQARVIGHADQTGPEKNRGYNEALAQKRAEAVEAFLVGLGIPADRIKVVSKGSSEPIAKVVDKDPIALEQNRRVDIQFIRYQKSQRVAESTVDEPVEPVATPAAKTSAIDPASVTQDSADKPTTDTNAEGTKGDQAIANEVFTDHSEENNAPAQTGDSTAKPASNYRDESTRRPQGSLRSRRSHY